MSAIVCGKRSFFEELQAASSPGAWSPPVSKKLRCSSPVRFSYSPPRSLIDQLKDLFPDMNSQFLEKVLEETGNNLEAAIKSLQELRLGFKKGAEANSSFTAEGTEKGATPTVEDSVPLEESQGQHNLPADGAEWVELFVKEMMSATSIDDARFRATSVLESLEKSISSKASAEAAQNFQKENMTLKEQIEALLRDNAILKRAVSIQHERQKEYDGHNQEVHHLKQLLAQYQERVRALEVNNYALTLHLRQAEQSNSIPGRFHPDVF